MADFGSAFGGAAGGGGGRPSFTLSGSTFSNLGGAVADIFGGFGDELKAKGAEIEAGQYRQAAGYAEQNIGFTQTSTAIKEMQQQRELEISQGKTEAAVAGAGFATSGSALDLLRESAQQGAITRQVLGFQGQITEAGYQEQAQALNAQASAADVAAQAAKQAETGSFISAALKGAGAIASLIAL